MYPRGILPHGRTGNRLEDHMPHHQSLPHHLWTLCAPAKKQKRKHRLDRYCTICGHKNTWTPLLQDVEHNPQVDHTVSTQSTGQLLRAAMQVVVSVNGAQLASPTAGADTARKRLRAAVPQVCAHSFQAVQLVVTHSAAHTAFEHVRNSDSTGQLHS